MSDTPKLIITADDYGMSPRFNEGVLEAVRAGVISGISVMVKRKYIDPQELLDLRIPLGLHLELEKYSPRQETTRQIFRFKKFFGKLPSYLDGHQHQHLAPEHFHEVIAAAKKFRLPVRSRKEVDRSLLRQHCISTPENFISWHPNRLHILEEKLAQSKQHALSELVVHPGYFDPTCSYPYNEQRESELHFLKSDFFRELISSFELTSYPRVNL